MDAELFCCNVFLPSPSPSGYQLLGLRKPDLLRDPLLQCFLRMCHAVIQSDMTRGGWQSFCLSLRGWEAELCLGAIFTPNASVELILSTFEWVLFTVQLSNILVLLLLTKTKPSHLRNSKTKSVFRLFLSSILKSGSLYSWSLTYANQEDYML